MRKNIIKIEQKSLNKIQVIVYTVSSRQWRLFEGSYFDEFLKLF